MELIVDAGNTRTKLAVFDGRDLIKLLVTEHHVSAKVMEELAAYTLNRIFISTVRNDESSQLRLWSELAPTQLFTAATKLPINNAYSTPETLGKDRIAGVIGARNHFEEGPILSIDIGTCITYDILTSENAYLGGNITPGIDLRYKAMNTFTGALPLVEDKENSDLYGQSTITSMSSGVLNGIVYEMEGFITNYEVEFPGLHVVLTGGDSLHFANRLKKKIFADPNLVLTGLHRILKFNEV